MDYKKPAEVMASMIQLGSDKMKLSTRDLMIRGILSGTILGCGTTLAVTATTQTGLALVGAAIFPACFVIVVLMGFELVTGSFAVLPAAYFDGRIRFGGMLRNLAVVYCANLLGGLLYALLFWISLTSFGSSSAGPVGAAIVKIAEAKTIGYAQLGAPGLLTAFTRGILCNWLVTMGVVLSLTSVSTLGKIAAAWLPVFLFFAQGFEHAVVNMFVLPAGMLLGADISVADWWLYNQLPVTAGNMTGGVVLTALALYATYRQREDKGALRLPVEAPHLLGVADYQKI